MRPNQGSYPMRAALVAVVVALALSLTWADAGATSQWSRKTGSDCNRCHTVFPRLNSFGEQYLRNGYVLEPSHKKAAEEDEGGGLTLPRLEHILGFRLNLTAIQLETHSLQRDSTANKTSRWTFGNPHWIQFFVAGAVQPHVSFFSELEYQQSAFKFNWFYFNLTRLGGSSALNAQVGNLSPLEFASYPNRLPQLPAIKGEVFLVKSSNGAGESSVDMSSARPGLQYYGYNDWLLAYAGVSPGTKATQVSQYLNGWAGAVFKIPDGRAGDFEGSTATLHYYAGTDTKNTGPTSGGQLTNGFTRLSPQVNIRYDERLDLQAAYVTAKDKNRNLVTSPTEDFEYSGLALEAGYMPRPTWHLGIHYDKLESDNEFTTGANAGKPIIELHRIVPAVTYVLNENMRGTIYWEHDLLDKPSEDKVDKIYLNVRAMF